MSCFQCSIWISKLDRTDIFSKIKARLKRLSQPNLSHKDTVYMHVLGSILIIFSKNRGSFSCFVFFVWLGKLIPSDNAVYDTGNNINIPLLNLKYNLFKNCIFPSTIIEWNSLDPKIWNSQNYSSLKYIWCPSIITFFNNTTLKE